MDNLVEKTSEEKGSFVLRDEQETASFPLQINNAVVISPSTANIELYFQIVTISSTF